MYDQSVPVLIHGLKSIAAVMAKAEAHCAARKIDPGVLLTARLFPDMHPFTRQVQTMTDYSKGCGARLAGMAVPSFVDGEKTFADLQARIAKTIDFLGSLDKAAFAGAEGRMITLKTGGVEQTLPGASYLARVVLPNFYFHMTTAYNILRHNGVELGKDDFLGRKL